MGSLPVQLRFPMTPCRPREPASGSHFLGWLFEGGARGGDIRVTSGSGPVVTSIQTVLVWGRGGTDRSAAPTRARAIHTVVAPDDPHLRSELTHHRSRPNARRGPRHAGRNARGDLWTA